MSTQEMKQIEAAITALNSLYGRGDVKFVSYPSIERGVEHGTFNRVPFGCKPETLRYRIVGNSVHACGHQKRMA